MLRRFYIKVYGCLFNWADAERIRNILHKAGFTETSDYKSADIIILVTCSVRAKAEHKVLDWGNKIKKLSKKPIIVLTGCMIRRDYLHEDFSRTKKHLKDLERKASWVDIFMDITNMHKLPEILQFSGNKLKENKFSLALSRQSPTQYLKESPMFSSQIYAYIPIMTGCDQLCTYCVVPYSRGKEQYREYDDVINDVLLALEENKRIIILLGQIIDKWHDKKAQKNFTQLLRDIAKLKPKQDYFVTFTSPHPSYITQETLETIAQEPKIFKHLGLPLQSGSNRVLKAMNRPYTREQYLKIAKLARKTIKNLYLTTDIIVGFPPETDKDFEQTLDIVKQIKFDKIFFAKYSPRLNLAHKPIVHNPTYQKEVAKRFDKLNDLASKIFAQNNQKQIGKQYKAVYIGKNQAISTRYQLVDLQNIPQNLTPGDIINIAIIDGGRRGIAAKVEV